MSVGGIELTEGAVVEVERHVVNSGLEGTIRNGCAVEILVVDGLPGLDFAGEENCALLNLAECPIRNST